MTRAVFGCAFPLTPALCSLFFPPCHTPRDTSSILISTRYPRGCIARHRRLANISACLTIYSLPRIHTCHSLHSRFVYSLYHGLHENHSFLSSHYIIFFFFPPSRNPNILSSLIGLFSLPAFPTFPSCIFSHPDFHALMQSLFFIVGTYLFIGITSNPGLFFNLCIIFIGDIYITPSYLGR